MQAKRFFAESGKEKKRTVEITDTANAVFGGQVFAEMLAAVCHEEHYRYSDQEVPLPNTHTPTGHTLRDVLRLLPLSSSFSRLVPWGLPPTIRHLLILTVRRLRFTLHTLHSNYTTVPFPPGIFEKFMTWASSMNTAG